MSPKIYAILSENKNGVEAKLAYQCGFPFIIQHISNIFMEETLVFIEAFFIPASLNKVKIARKKLLPNMYLFYDQVY